MYKTTTLPNGLRIATNYMSNKESCAVGIWIKTGSRNENKKISGISHFLEHMLFKGTPLRNCRKIKEEIEGRGGSLNGFTSEETTCFLAKVGHSHLEIALDVLIDMVLNASLKTMEIERERAVIVEEIKMYQDLPSHYVHDLLSELMWEGHELGMSIAGTMNSVGSMTRKDIFDYKSLTYTSDKIVVTICGNIINQDRAYKKINSLFRNCRKKDEKPLNLFKNTQSHQRIKIFNKETAQSHLCLGFHSPGREHKDKYAIYLLNIILGANMSSRLFENVREKKGLAYEIGSEIKKYKETGAFIVNAGIEHKKVPQALALILSELKKIKKTYVHEDELKRAKEFFKVQLLLSLEDSLDHMLWLGGRLITTDKLPDKAEIIKHIESVEIEDIKRVAAYIFNTDNLNMALIGTLKDTEQKQVERELIL